MSEGGSGVEGFQKTTVVAALLVVLVSGVAWYLNTSLWLLWHLLPEQADSKVALVVDDPILEPLLPELSLLVPEDVRSIIPAVNSLAVSVSDTTVVTVMPKLTARRAVVSRLRAAGWQVESVGLALRATSENNSSVPALGPSLRQLAATLVTRQLPAKPLAVATITNSFLTEPTSFIATRQGTTIHLLAVDSFTSISELPLAPSASSTAGMTISVPGYLLNSLPSDLKASWNAQLQQRLGLTSTAPDIISYISQFGSVTIEQTVEAVTIQVAGAPDAFISTATAWVEADDRRTRPQRQAFRLPDGTLGYEQVPGAAEPVFRPASNGCFTPIAGKTTLWLCQHDTTATLSTIEVNAQTPQPTSDQWTLQVNQAGLAELTSTIDCQGSTDRLTRFWCAVSSVTATGQNNRAIVEVTFR